MTKSRIEKSPEAGDAGTCARARGMQAKMREKAPQPHRARHYARKKFAEQLPQIFNTYATAAIGGDIASLKALISLVGFDREDAHVAPVRRRRGRSVSQMLLEELKKSRAGAAEGEAND